MAALHQITPSLASSYKAVRLRALQDTPSAFGSTYARESQFSDADWQQRAANLCTPRSIGYLAHHHDEYCGIAAAFLDVHGKVQTLLTIWALEDRLLLLTPPGFGPGSGLGIRRLDLGRLLFRRLDVGR